MNINWKSLWAWFCGFAAGPIGVYTPYMSTIFEKGWTGSHIPGEAHATAFMLVLAGLGLINMRRPSDHPQDLP